MDTQPISYQTIDARNSDAKILSDAYAAFVKFAPQIFADPSINPQTGQTVYADIETKDVWERLLAGIQSKTGMHHAIITLARNERAEVVGFELGIYHQNSNSANITYAAVENEYQNQGILTKMNAAVLKGLNGLSQHYGYDGTSAVFIERANKLPGAISEHAIALKDWQSPLLISDGAGGYNTQDLRLIVKWAPGSTPERKAETVSLFAQDFYALYSGALISGGVVENENRFYPATESLGYKSPAVQSQHLLAMQSDAHLKYGVPLRDTKSLIRASAKPAHTR